MRRLLIALTALIAVAAAPPAHRPPLAATPIARLELPWWKERFAEKQARLHQGRVDLVWYGDSITQDWESSAPPAWRDFRPVWEKYYGDRNAVNLGFKGDTTASLLWRLEHGEADGIAPRLAIVLIGANNLGRLHWSAEDTVAGIDADIAAIRQHLPRTKIILLAILPSIRNEWATQTTLIVNQSLAQRYAANPDVKYVDPSAIFLRDGQVDANRFLDVLMTPPDPPLHPSVAAQAGIAEMIEPSVAAIMGDRKH